MCYCEPDRIDVRMIYRCSAFRGATIWGKCGASFKRNHDLDVINLSPPSLFFLPGECVRRLPILPMIPLRPRLQSALGQARAPVSLLELNMMGLYSVHI